MDESAEETQANGLSKLDTLVRSLLLRYPTLFGTRWDVLRHLYLVIGNGYEWSDGELVDVVGADERTDEQAVAGFFRDIDGHREEWQELGLWSDKHERAHDLHRRRRQFQLDNLDAIVHESRMDAGVPFDVASILIHTAVDYSRVFHVPDDVEASFRDGAVEVLREALSGLYYEAECGRDRGLRAALEKVYRKLVPPPRPEEQEFIRQLLAGPAEQD